MTSIADPPPSTELQVPAPSDAQILAITAPLEPTLVLAGPGAGKTYCLIERIRYLIETAGIQPARVCTFTFTNKAAGEIAHRLESRLGAERAAYTKRGTIHAFCAELLREMGSAVGLERGFGIADEEYQLRVLRRLDGVRPWHRNTLNKFSAHRFRSDPLTREDAQLFERYETFLRMRNVVDFDTLVTKAAELLERSEEGAAIRSRWDVILVDEFQDLNPVQYRVVRALAKDHKNVFAVGDDEQSIYSWAGAEPRVFLTFMNDFGITAPIHLDENRRCPGDVFSLARTLVNVNTPIFARRAQDRAPRASAFPVAAQAFSTDDAEGRWLVEDISRDRNEHGHAWGDVALLYRTHEIGNALEARFLAAGLPCRLAQGRALADDPIVSYLIAALRVISQPNNDVYRDAYFGVVLPTPLINEATRWGQTTVATPPPGYPGRPPRERSLTRQLQSMARELPKADERRRQIRRAIYDVRNLAAIGRSSSNIATLIQDLLSRRVGKFTSLLDDRHDDLTDPITLPDVVALAERLDAARKRDQTIWISRMGGLEIALKGILTGVGFTHVMLGGTPPEGAERIEPDATPSVGIALGVFKAAQMIEMGETTSLFGDFTAVDLETTDRDIRSAEIVEIAAVRVRGGKIVDQFSCLVRPSVAIAPGAAMTHGITADQLANAPDFANAWPAFREFCGDDVLVAHNGYDFDFPILARMAKQLGSAFDLCTYDTLPLARDLFPTSRKLGDLATRFGVPTGQSHRALDDTLALAQVAVFLDEAKRARARKTALVSLLDYLGLALALSDPDALTEEARMLRDATRVFALGRYSQCLEHYERAVREFDESPHAPDEQIADVDEAIKRLGGSGLMVKIRTEKSADERYPATMLRLRRLITEIAVGPLEAQLALFLERAVLSKHDGPEPDRGRVNLLTLHSTKGLEFSRVYVVGVEDSELPGGSVSRGVKEEEIEEARRLLYVGMTRTIDRLVLTHADTRGGHATRGRRFLDEMGLASQRTEAP